MSELQIGLIGLGVVAVGGMLAYNKWQEYRHRKVAEQVLQSDHKDVLLDVGQDEVCNDDVPAIERREPVLSENLPEDVPPFAQEQDETPASAADGQRHADDADNETFSGQPAGELPASLLDERTEFIVTMELVEPVPAQQILYSQREALARLSKPVHWIGYNERQREWEMISPDSDRPYRRLRIGLQLADRRGPLSEVDFTVFVAAMQQLADELMAVADMSPRQSVLERAAELDRFCAEVDLEIGVHLISRGTPFPGTKIRALAEASGMVLGEDGLFSRFDDDGRIQFCLQNFESTLFMPDSIKNLSTHGLTFLLDVPRVDHGERVFFVMVDHARRFAEALQGQLVDDNRQPLSEAQLDRIKREFVVKPQATMTGFGLSAGSPQALRLFS